MAHKNQEMIKQELVETVDGAVNFSDMMAKIAVYIQERYDPKIDEMEVIETLTH